MSEQLRKEFEAWMASQCNGLLKYSTMYSTARRGKGYVDSITNMLWESWQASRAALEIEMPPKLTQGDDYADGWNHALVLASGEIGIAGVRVKP